MPPIIEFATLQQALRGLTQVDDEIGDAKVIGILIAATVRYVDCAGSAVRVAKIGPKQIKGY